MWVVKTNISEVSFALVWCISCFVDLSPLRVEGTVEKDHIHSIIERGHTHVPHLIMGAQGAVVRVQQRAQSGAGVRVWIEMKGNQPEVGPPVSEHGIRLVLDYYMLDLVFILGKLLLFNVVWTLTQWNWILVCCFIYQLSLLLELNMVGKSRPSYILILKLITIFYLILVGYWDFASIFYLYVLVFKCGWWYVLVFKCNQLDQSLLPFSCCFAWVTTTINQTLQFLFLLCHGIKLKLALI